MRRSKGDPPCDRGLEIRAKRQGGLEAELKRPSLIPVIVVGEVGYFPFDPEAASLMFSLAQRADRPRRTLPTDLSNPHPTRPARFPNGLTYSDIGI